MASSRLYLITPRAIDLATFPATLEAALKGGDVASLLIAPELTSDMALQRVAEVLAPIAQAHGVAVLVANDTRATGRAKADGLHVDTGPADLEVAIKSLQPRSIVGAGGVKTRHDAMEAAELGADYVFFGKLTRPEEPETNEKSLDLADWWAPLFQTPCVLLAGASLDSVGEAAETGADFIALRDAIWQHPAGPAAAIADANRRIAEAVVPEQA